MDEIKCGTKDYSHNAIRGQFRGTSSREKTGRRKEKEGRQTIDNRAESRGFVTV
jgi:hypothetical protein